MSFGVGKLRIVFALFAALLIAGDWHWHSITGPFDGYLWRNLADAYLILTMVLLLLAIGLRKGSLQVQRIDSGQFSQTGQVRRPSRFHMTVDVRTTSSKPIVPDTEFSAGVQSSERPQG